jgi:UDP-N-acetyl-D-mannosaminuronic acid dehydrogenase
LRINDGMARALVEVVKKAIPLTTATVGLLGYAFKSGSDDSRWSPAKELKQLLAAEAKAVLCTDPHASDPGLTTLAEVIGRSDVLFVVSPHPEYRGMVIPAGKIVIDPWGILGVGASNSDARAEFNEHGSKEEIYYLIGHVS